MFTSIAVPLDGSAFGDFAVPYAAALARLSGAALELLHVHRPYMPGAALEALPQFRFQDIVEADDAADEAALQREEVRLEEIAKMLAAESGIVVTSRVLRGDPAEALTEHVQRSGADLIVMSTHGAGGAARAWLGSISDYLVRHSTVPVLLVRPGEGPVAANGEVHFRRMLVPVDGSAFSEAILEPAAELARLMNAELTLLYVASPGDGHWLRARMRTPAQSPHFVEEYLDALASGFPTGRKLPRVRVVTHWNPARAILDEAGRGDYDLIAMATHGRGGLRPMLLGSTADKVLRGGRMPVFVLRPHEVAHDSAVLDGIVMSAVE